MNKARLFFIATGIISLGALILGRNGLLTEAPFEVPGKATQSATARTGPNDDSVLGEKDTASANRDAQVDPSSQGPSKNQAIQAPATQPVELAVINEKTLVGTGWGSDQFKLEFGPAGKLLIGGDARANWRIENGRVKLYSSDGREVHWLDIEGNRLTWNGEPLGRFK